MTLTAPQPINEQHEIGAFDSGVPLLDDWLKRRARANQASGASRTYVVCEEQRVVAYYALASGAVDIENASGRVRRNMPDPVPVAVLGTAGHCAKLSKARPWTRLDTRRGNPRPASRRSDRHSRNCRSCDFARRQSVLSGGRVRGFAPRTPDAHGDARGYSGRD